MKKGFVTTLIVLVLVCATFISGCSNSEKNSLSNENVTSKVESVSDAESSISDAEQFTQATPTPTPDPAAYTPFVNQGNPHTVVLGEIAEKDKAWIKISTLFDPDLSMYSADIIPEKVTAVIVDFKVSGLESPTTLYWCYMVNSGENTISIWDESSDSDKLEITADGKYRLVFDARRALGGTLDVVSSLQIVFPNISDSTTTEFKVENAGYVLSDDISAFVSGNIE